MFALDGSIQFPAARTVPASSKGAVCKQRLS